MLHAASFDCSALLTPIEQLICSNPELSSLDDALGAAYEGARSASGSPARNAKEQRQWLIARNDCANKECLKMLYEARIGELQALSSGASLSKQPEYTKLVAEASLSGRWSPLSPAHGAADMTLTPSAMVDHKGRRIAHRFLYAKDGAYIFRVDPKRSRSELAPNEYAPYAVYVLSSPDSLSVCFYSEEELKTALRFCVDAGGKYVRIR
jgi:hypothetical protein